MAEQSVYLNRLNWLRKLIVGKEGSSENDGYGQLCSDQKEEPSFNGEMSERLRLLSILVAVQDTIQFFNEEISKAEASIRLHIDEDIDYLKWCDPNWIIGHDWMGSEEEIVQEQLKNAWKANLDTLLGTNDAINLAAYMPIKIKPEFDEKGGKESLGNALFLLAGPYYNTSNLKMAIYNAVNLLADTLKRLKSTILKDRGPEVYAQLVCAQWTAYNMVRDGEAVEIRKKYEADKEGLSEPISYEWLNNRRNKAIEDFKESGFVAAKMKEVGLDATNAFNRLCSLKNGDVVFDKDADVGRFICKQRICQQQMNELFAFRKRIELLQEDLKHYPLAQTPTPKSTKGKTVTPKKSRHFLPTPTFIYQYMNADSTASRRLPLLYQYLSKEYHEVKSYIDTDTNPNDFYSIFNGETNNNVIVWTGSKQDLYYFIKRMVERKILDIPQGQSIWNITQNHFSDRRGNIYLDLRSQHKPKNSALAIEQLIDILDPAVMSADDLTELAKKLSASFGGK